MHRTQRFAWRTCANVSLRYPPFDYSDLGGGGESYHRARPPKPVLKVGFAWSVPVSSKENNRAETNGAGKTYHRWGGPKPFLGRGFMVCFPLPWVFHPLCFFFFFSEKRSLRCESAKICGFLQPSTLLGSVCRLRSRPLKHAWVSAQTFLLRIFLFVRWKGWPGSVCFRKTFLFSSPTKGPLPGVNTPWRVSISWFQSAWGFLLVAQTLHHLCRATLVALHCVECRTRIALHPFKKCLKKGPVAPFGGGVAPQLKFCSV